VADNVRTLSDSVFRVLEACLFLITSQVASNFSVNSFNETSLSVHCLFLSNISQHRYAQVCFTNDSPSAVEVYPSCLQMESIEGKSSTCSMIQQALKA
jgi:hypothetical protein